MKQMLRSQPMKNINTKLSLFLSLVAVLIASACAQQNPDGTRSAGISKSQAGTVLGGIGGGIAGHNIGKGTGNTVATIGGAVLGGMVGNSVGNSLERADNAQYAHGNARPVNNNNPLQSALESARTGETSSWTNSDGSVTRITPTGTYTNNNGQACRNYTQTNSYGGQSSGTACRSNNGYWN